MSAIAWQYFRFSLPFSVVLIECRGHLARVSRCRGGGAGGIVVWWPSAELTSPQLVDSVLTELQARQQCGKLPFQALDPLIFAAGMTAAAALYIASFTVPFLTLGLPERSTGTYWVGPERFATREGTAMNFPH